MNLYFKSKTLAEKEAWKYVEEHKDLELAVINPYFILGPSHSSGTGFSETWMKNWLNGTRETVAKTQTSFVDVRDVALAHLKALEVPEANGKRFLLCGHDVWQEEVAKILINKYPRYRGIPRRFEKGEYPKAGNDVDNTRSIEVLGIEYTPFEKTILDMAESLHDRKIFEPR